jgi:superfamily II DNA or RNA helicase
MREIGTRPPSDDAASRKPSRREELRASIAREEARIVQLEAEGIQARMELATLRSELAALGDAAARREACVSQPAAGAPKSPMEKVRLFRSLFRGRLDVFPTRFVSRRTGKAGYAPACQNKFVRGVCDLPRVRCGECPNQAFLPLDDEAVLAHLTGRHVMGLYPLLEDESCWLLAVDFDKGTWDEDVMAFAETCRQAGMPAAIERSRSGSGAHAWMFFAAPVPASAARAMGSHLLTETLTRRHQLGLDSYDRLFPSQDTLPRGGFGNLIALPLQHEARQAGNTVFLDSELRPYADQWAYLASVSRIDPADAARMARDATREGSVVGLPPVEVGEAEPWLRRPSRPPRRIRGTGPLPQEVRVVLAQRLFVEKAGLPSPMIDQIRRLAAFQNPEFYKRERLRLSTALTPRVIGCSEDLPQHVALPRGCLGALQVLLRDHGVALELQDERTSGVDVAFEFRGTLTRAQEQAARALLAHDTGVLVAPPGAGKTVIGTWLVAARGCSTLVLVHRRPLLDQWRTQLSMFLGLEPKAIGQVGGGRRAPNGRLDVAMLQSLVRGGRVDDGVASYGQVVVDECHHLPAVSFERVLADAKARYVVGLTATPQRRDGHHPITEMQLGPVRFMIDPRRGSEPRPFAQRLIARETGFRPAGENGEPTIQELYAALVADEKRNAMILDDVIGALEEGRSPILLTERRDHLEDLATQLEKFARHLIVLRGGMSARERQRAKARLAGISETEERLVLSTGRYAGEGFDDARLDTLFLALPISWKGTLVQYAGRLHRPHPAKKEVRIFDYVDRGVPMLERMFERRLRGYRALGYARGEAPLGFAEAPAELLLEYDEEALRALDRADELA